MPNDIITNILYIFYIGRWPKLLLTLKGRHNMHPHSEPALKS